MTKFSAQSIVAFFSAQAVAGRVARKAKFVVLVEVYDGSWCELDADDQGHAGVLARNWVQTLTTRAALPAGACSRAARWTVTRSTHFDTSAEAA